jgi:hypothetical protein
MLPTSAIPLASILSLAEVLPTQKCNKNSSFLEEDLLSHSIQGIQGGQNDSVQLAML